MRDGKEIFFVRKAAPIVGSLFGWKSLLTKRRTREDCVVLVAAVRGTAWTVDLSYGGFTEQNQLHAAAWLGRIASCCVAHREVVLGWWKRCSGIVERLPGVWLRVVQSMWGRTAAEFAIYCVKVSFSDDLFVVCL